jgi:hypothetical protein
LVGDVPTSALQIKGRRSEMSDLMVKGSIGESGEPARPKRLPELGNTLEVPLVALIEIEDVN